MKSLTVPTDWLPWFDFECATPNGGTAHWHVALVGTAIDLGNTYVYGCTCFTRRLILIDAKQSRVEQDETLLHELMHVASDTSERETGEGIPQRTEERAIGHISPSLVTILKIYGWTPPRRPKGTAALERRARARDNDA